MSDERILDLPADTYADPVRRSRSDEEILKDVESAGVPPSSELSPVPTDQTQVAAAQQAIPTSYQPPPPQQQYTAVGTPQTAMLGFVSPPPTQTQAPTTQPTDSPYAEELRRKLLETPPTPTPTPAPRRTVPQQYTAAGAPQDISGFEQPTSWWSDAGRQLEVGGLGLVHDIANFAQWSLGQMGAEGASNYMKTQRDQAAASLQNVVKGLSPEVQKAMGSSLFGITGLGGQVDPTTGRVPTISDVGVGNYATTLVSQIPPLLLFFVPGGIVGRVAAGAAKGVGLGEAAATAATRLPLVATPGEIGAAGAAARTAAVAPIRTAARIGTTGVLGGSVQAGAALDQLEQEIKNMPQATADANPAYQMFRSQGMNDQQAREAMTKGGASVLLAMAQFGVGAVTSTLTGDILRGAGRGGVASRVLQPTTRTGQAALSGVEAGTLMGAQAGGAQAIQQGLSPARTEPVNWTDVAQTTGAGFAGGAALGGALGFGVGPRARPIVPPGPVDKVTPAGLDPAVEAAARLAQGQTRQQALPTPVGRIDPNAPTGLPPGGPRIDPNAPMSGPGGIGRIDPNAPAGGGDGPRIDPNAPVAPPTLQGSRAPMGVSAPTIDFSTPVTPAPRPIDTGAPRVDPNAPGGVIGPRVDPNAPVLSPAGVGRVDPNAPVGTGGILPRVDPNAPPAPPILQGSRVPQGAPAPVAPVQALPTAPVPRLRPIDTGAARVDPNAVVSPVGVPRVDPNAPRPVGTAVGRLDPNAPTTRVGPLVDPKAPVSLPILAGSRAPMSRAPVAPTPRVPTTPDGRINFAAMDKPALEKYAVDHGIPSEMAAKVSREGLVRQLDNRFNKTPENRQEMIDRLLESGRSSEEVGKLSPLQLEEAVAALDKAPSTPARVSDKQPLRSGEEEGVTKVKEAVAKSKKAKTTEAITEPEAGAKRPSEGLSVTQLRDKLFTEFGEKKGSNIGKGKTREALATHYDELVAEREAKASGEPVKPTTEVTKEGTTGVAPEARASLPAGERGMDLKIDELRRRLVKDFGEDKKWVYRTGKGVKEELAERYDELKAEADRSEAEQQAFYKEKNIKMPESKVQPLVALKTTTPAPTAEQVAASTGTLRKAAEARRTKDTVIDPDEAETTDTMLAEGKLGPRAEPEIEEESAQSGVRQEDVTSWQDLGEVSFRDPIVPNLDNVTNRKKTGRTLENYVTHNNMSPENAARMWQNRFGASPKAEIKSFGDYLDRRIAYLSDNQNYIDHAGRVAEANTPAKIKAHNMERDAFDVEHIEYLEAMRKALSGKDADVQAFDDLHAARSSTYTAPSSERVNPTLDIVDRMRRSTNRSKEAPPSSGRIYEPQANRAVMELHNSAPANKAQTFMSRVANDPWIKANMPEVARLAAKYRRLLPDHIEVMTAEEYVRRYPNARRPDIFSSGLFDPANDVIVLNRRVIEQGGNALDVIMHEVNHAITSPYFERARVSGRALDVLNTIREEFMRAKDSISDPELRRAFDHALSDPHELHTMLTTHPGVSELARNMTPTPEFKARMAGYGYRPSELRNMWSSFVGWIRRVLGMEPREVSDSLLEHITRPLDDILREAARSEYGSRRTGPVPLSVLDRAAYRPYDWRMNTMIEGYNRQQFFFDHTRNALRRQAERTTFTDATARTGFWNTVRPKLLQAMTPDVIVDRYGPSHFTSSDGDNLLAIQRAAEHKINQFGEKFKDTYIPKAENIIDRLWGRKEVSDLLVDATMAKAHLGTNDPTANDHLVSQAERTRLADVQDRYSRLSGEEKSVYNDTRDMFKKIHEAEREAQLQGLIQGVFGDAEITHGQRESLANLLRTKRGIESIIQDRSNIGQTFGEAWTRWRPLARAVANFHNQGFVEGDYFPLRRYGDYVIRYGDRNPTSAELGGVEMFDTLREAQTRQAQLMRDGLNPTDIQIKSQKHARALVDFSTGFLREINDAVSNKFVGETKNAVLDLIANQALQHMSRSEQNRLAVTSRREYVQGASKDAIRTIAADVNATARRMGYAMHGPEVAAIRERIRNHIAAMDRRTDPVTGAEMPPSNRALEAGQIQREFELRRPNSDEPTNTGAALAAGRITQGTFVHSLLSFSQAIVNSLEAHIMGASLMGGRHGFARSALGLAKAMNEMLPTALQKVGSGTTQSVKALMGMGREMRRADWQMANVFKERLVAKGANSEHMSKLFEELTAAGVMNHSLSSDLRNLANPTFLTRSATGRTIQRFVDASSVMGHVAEEVNKAAIAKTAFDLELHRNGGDVGKAVEYAVNQVRRAVPNWANKARIATAAGSLGKLGPAIMQFRNYGLHMYSLLPLLFHEAKLGNKESARTLAMLVGSWSVAAGAFAWMADPIRLAGGLYDIATGATHPHDWHREIDRGVADLFGPTIGEVISKGPLYSLAGIDITHRVGLMNPINLPDLASYRLSDWWAAAGKLAGGASSSTFLDMVQAVRKGVSGDLVGAVQGVVPRNIRDIIAAEEMARKGVLDSKGRQILPPSQIGIGALIAKGIGIQPSQVSRVREGRAAETEVRVEMGDARGQAINAFVESRQQGTNWGSAYQQVQAFNKANPRTPIKPAQLEAALKAANEGIMSPFGLRVPKNQIQTMREATRYIPQGA